MKAVHQRVAAAAINDTRGVAHQVLDRDLAIGRHAIGGRLAVRIARGDAHLREFRKILGKRIVDQDLALLVQHQGAHRRHRFGHRRDVEDGVGGHGDDGCLVAPAIGIERDQFAVPGNGDDRAGNASGLDVGFQGCADPRQPFAGEPDVFGLGARQGVIGEGRAGSEQAKRGRENFDGSHGRLPFGLFGPWCL
jgi:hypothetical protein